MATSEAPVESATQCQIASAIYQSPDNAPFLWEEKGNATPPSDKTAYLAALRQATAKMQDQLNAELTARMEEDKGREADTASRAKAKGVVDEANEEDNYGEEVVEED